MTGVWFDDLDAEAFESLPPIDEERSEPICRLPIPNEPPCLLEFITSFMMASAVTG